MNFDNLATVIITQAATLGTIYLREYWIKRKLAPKPPVSQLDTAELYVQLTKNCAAIREDLNADGVYIAYFHNGIVFKNGLHNYKFTVIAEDYDNPIRHSYIDRYKDIGVSYITHLYHKLLVKGRVYMENVEQLDLLDTNLKQDLIDRKVKNSYAFLLKDPCGRAVGFIGIDMCWDRKITPASESVIWKHEMNSYNIINNIKTK